MEQEVRKIFKSMPADFKVNFKFLHRKEMSYEGEFDNFKIIARFNVGYHFDYIMPVEYFFKFNEWENIMIVDMNNDELVGSVSTKDDTMLDFYTWLEEEAKGN